MGATSQPRRRWLGIRAGGHSLGSGLCARGLPSGAGPGNDPDLHERPTGGGAPGAWGWPLALVGPAVHARKRPTLGSQACDGAAGRSRAAPRRPAQACSPLETMTSRTRPSDPPGDGLKSRGGTAGAKRPKPIDHPLRVVGSGPATQAAAEDHPTARVAGEITDRSPLTQRDRGERPWVAKRHYSNKTRTSAARKMPAERNGPDEPPGSSGP